MRIKHNDTRRGQVMVMTIVVMSATFIAATTIGGMLIVYQMQQAVDEVNSAQAIAAADAGIEYQLCMFFRNDPAICGDSLPVFSNGASVENASTQCRDISGNEMDCKDPGVRMIRVNSTGLAGKPREARRLLQLDTSALF